MTPAALALSTLHTLQGLGAVLTLTFDWATRTYEPQGNWTAEQLQHVHDNASLYGLRSTQPQPWQPSRLVSANNSWDESFSGAPVYVTFPDPAPTTPAPTTPAPATPAPTYVYAPPVLPTATYVYQSPVAPTTPAPTTPAPTTPAPTTPAPTTPAPTTPAPTTPAPTTPAPTTPAPTTPALTDEQINALWAQDLARLRNGQWEYQWADGVWRNTPDPQQLAKWTQAGRVATGQGTPFVYAGGVTPTGGASGYMPAPAPTQGDQLTEAFERAQQWVKDQPYIAAAAAAAVYFYFRKKKGRR